MASSRPPADPRALVRVLEEEGVDYVVVGGWAAVTYGVDRATFGLDVLTRMPGVGSYCELRADARRA